MRIVTFGEIMLRLEPPGHGRLRHARTFDALYGGGEANVAASLANFGLTAEYVTRLPANDLGDACLAFLRQYGVGVDHVLRGGARLGIYFSEKGAAQRGSKVIYDRVGSSLAEIEPGMVDWPHVFAGADWFHFTGITPAVSASAAAVSLEAAQQARTLGLTISCDLNYRKNLWRWGKQPAEIMPALVSLCDVLIANEEDADKVFGVKATGVEVTAGAVAAGPYREVAGEIAHRFSNLRTIAFTLRGSLSASRNTWSGALWQAGDFHVGPLYDIIPIVDRVGGGDAFAAGLIYGLLVEPHDVVAALRFAVAASCLKHTVPGDFNAVTVAEVRQLMAGDASGRVSR